MKGAACGKLSTLRCRLSLGWFQAKSSVPTDCCTVRPKPGELVPQDAPPLSRLRLPLLCEAVDTMIAGAEAARRCSAVLVRRDEDQVAAEAPGTYPDQANSTFRGLLTSRDGTASTSHRHLQRPPDKR